MKYTFRHKPFIYLTIATLNSTNSPFRKGVAEEAALFLFPLMVIVFEGKKKKLVHGGTLRGAREQSMKKSKRMRSAGTVTRERGSADRYG